MGRTGLIKNSFIARAWAFFEKHLIKHPALFVIGVFVLSALFQGWSDGDWTSALFLVFLIAALFAFSMERRHREREVKRQGMIRIICEDCGCEIFTTAKQYYDIDCPDCGCPMEKIKEAP